MCEIFATGQDPHKYSFNYTTKDLRNSKMNIFSRGLCISSIGFWEQIKLELINRPQAICPDELEWIKHTDFEREIKSTKMRAGIFYETYHLVLSIKSSTYSQYEQICCKNILAKGSLEIFNTLLPFILTPMCIEWLGEIGLVISSTPILSSAISA